MQHPVLDDQDQPAPRTNLDHARESWESFQELVNRPEAGMDEYEYYDEEDVARALIFAGVDPLAEFTEEPFPVEDSVRERMEKLFRERFNAKEAGSTLTINQTRELLGLDPLLYGDEVLAGENLIGFIRGFGKAWKATSEELAGEAEAANDRARKYRAQLGDLSRNMATQTQLEEMNARADDLANLLAADYGFEMTKNPVKQFESALASLAIEKILAAHKQAKDSNWAAEQARKDAARWKRQLGHLTRKSEELQDKIKRLEQRPTTQDYPPEVQTILNEYNELAKLDPRTPEQNERLSILSRMLSNLDAARTLTVNGDGK